MDHDPSAGVKRRACTNCTAAKAKCTQSGHGLCERCRRLGKRCVYVNISEKRRKSRDTTRVQKLEEKVEELVTRLSVISRQHPQSTTFLPNPSSTSTFASPPTYQNGLSPPLSLPASSDKSTSNPVSWGDNSPSPDSVNEDGPDIIDRGLITLDDANSLIDIFRHSYMHQFPFVVLPPTATAASLRRERPFLFLSIVASTMYNNSPMQRYLGKEIQKKIASKMIIRNEQSMDLLQGLMIHVAWYHYFFQPRSQQVFLMLQLCVALVHEMGLDRSSRGKKQKNHGDSVGLNEVDRGVVETLGNRTPDEMRAFLGVYVLSAALSKAFHKQTIMSHTTYVDHCGQYLSEANLAPSDRWIKRIVEIYGLLRRVSDTFCYHSLEDCKVLGEGCICLAVDGFKRELERLRNDALPDSAATGYELSLFHDVQLVDAFIHEVAFHDKLWENAVYGLATNTNSFSPARANMLWHTLAVSKAYVNTFLTIPTQQLFHLTLLSWTTLCSILIIYCKIIFFQTGSQLLIDHADECSAFEFELSLPPNGSVWDSGLAAKEGDFPRLVGLLEAKFAAITTNTISEEGDRDTMYQFAFFMRTVLNGYDNRAKKMETHGSGDEDQTGNTNTRTTDNTSSPIEHPQSTRMSDQHNEREREPTTNGVYPDAVTPASMKATEVPERDPNVVMEGTDGLGFDVSGDLPQGFFDDMAWDSMLQDFTVMPLP